jgi:hypothetical protein
MYISTSNIEENMDIIKKYRIDLPYDPATSIQTTCPKEIGISGDNCTPMFIEALLNSQHVESHEVSING